MTIPISPSGAGAAREAAVSALALLAVLSTLMIGAQAWPAPVTASWSLREEWAIGGADDEAVYGLIVDCARSADGRTYVLDRQLATVQVIDADGQTVASFGGMGEGPGEFNQPSDVAVLGDGRIVVLQSWPARLSVFAAHDLVYKGELDVRERPAAPTVFIGVGAMIDGVVLQELATVQTADGRSQRYAVTSYQGADGSGGRHELAAARRTMGGNRFVVREAEMNPLQWVSSGDRVGLNVGWRGDVSVVSVTGSERYHLEPTDAARLRSSAQRAAAEAYIRGGGGTARAEVIVEPTDRDIQWLGFGPDGALWLLTSQGATAARPGVLGRFRLYDSEGAFEGEVLLLGGGSPSRDKLVSDGGHLYVLTNYASAFANWRVGRTVGIGEAVGPDDAADAEPMGVVCYELPTLADLRAAAE